MGPDRCHSIIGFAGSQELSRVGLAGYLVTRIGSISSTDGNETMTKDKSSPEELGRVLDAVTAADLALGGKLEAYARAVRQHLPDVTAANERLLQRVSQNGASEYAPAVGDQLPDGVFPDTEGHLVRLATLLAAGPLVVSFNRGAWCGYCSLELRALAAAHSAIAALGASIVAIVPESEEYAHALKTTCALPFAVLVDHNLGYALSLGLVFWSGAELKDAFLKLGVDLGKFQGNDGWFLPIPATFVVARDGRVLARFIDPDFRRRMPIEDIIDSLREEQRKGSGTP
jgi:peroxiredoxin